MELLKKIRKVALWLIMGLLVIVSIIFFNKLGAVNTNSVNELYGCISSVGIFGALSVGIFGTEYLID